MCDVVLGGVKNGHHDYWVNLTCVWVYVCVCICVCVCVCVCLCLYVYVYTCLHITPYLAQCCVCVCM